MKSMGLASAKPQLPMEEHVLVLKSCDLAVRSENFGFRLIRHARWCADVLNRLRDRRNIL